MKNKDQYQLELDFNEINEDQDLTDCITVSITGKGEEVQKFMAGEEGLAECLVQERKVSQHLSEQLRKTTNKLKEPAKWKEYLSGDVLPAGCYCIAYGQGSVGRGQWTPPYLEIEEPTKFCQDFYYIEVERLP